MCGKKCAWCVVAMAAFLYAMQANAGVIYQDSFARGTSLSPVDLDGSLPTTTTGGAAWLAYGWATDGTRGNVSDLLSYNADNAYLPFTPVGGNVYTLSVVMNVTSGGANWMAVGFSSTAPTHALNNGLGVWSNNGCVGTDLLTNAGTLYAANGPDLAGIASVGTGYTGEQALSIVLDTTPALPQDWTFAFKVGTATVRTATAFGGTGPNISYVGFGNYAHDSGYVKDFSLTVASTPEPSASVLLATGLFGLLAYAWRKRK